MLCLQNCVLFLRLHINVLKIINCEITWSWMSYSLPILVTSFPTSTSNSTQCCFHNAGWPHWNDDHGTVYHQRSCVHMILARYLMELSASFWKFKRKFPIYFFTCLLISISLLHQVDTHLFVQWRFVCCNLPMFDLLQRITEQAYALKNLKISFCFL